MAAADFRICPNCGTRNKKGWEYCVRCGDDIHSVPLGEPVSSVAVAEEEPTSAGGSWLGLVGAAVVVAVAAYASTKIRPPDPTRPDKALFEIPTLAPSIPAAAPVARTSAQAAFEQGRTLLTRGDAAGAVAALAQAVGDDPDNAEYRNVYGKALMASGAAGAEVVRQFQEACRLAPDSSEFRADVARALDKLGQTDEAVREYDRALEMNGNDKATLRQASALQTRLGHPEKALPYLTRLAGLSPDDLVVQQELGMALEKVGDKDAAARAYRGVLEQAPQAALTRGLLAEVLIKDGKGDEAVALLRAGVERDPGGALLHRTLASALERTGNVAEAIREYREYARLNPAAADAQAMTERAARLEARVAQAQSS
jgi:Flp pilus assembly protein TadD